MTKITYDFYLNGYDNGIQFGYIPDFGCLEDKIAYSLGYRDGKNRCEHKKPIEEFEKIDLKSNILY